MIPWLERDGVLADLAELYRVRVARRGPAAANRWYWRQVVIFAVRRPVRAAGGSMAGAALAETRQAARSLVRSPTFTITAALTLALGIGANTAVFSVVNSVLLRGMPYPEADRLLWVYTDAPPNRWPFSVADIQTLDERNRSFESVAAWSARNMTYASEGAAERILANRVTHDFFSTLGVAPALGRNFTEADGVPGAEPTVVVSHGFWQSRLGGDRDVLGRTVRLDGRTHTIVGVMAPEVGPLERPQSELWPVLQLEPPGRKGPFFLSIVARLRPGVTVAQANDELRRLNGEMFPEWADTYSDQTASWAGITAMEYLVGDARTALVALLIGAAVVMLIALTNVANLVLARTTAKAQESSVRAALGASRLRIASVRFSETVLLALLGAALGVMGAYAGVTYLLELGPRALPRSDEIGLDGAALGFALALTLVAAVAVGLLPELGRGRRALSTELRSGSRGILGVGFRKLRSTLVGLQFAFAIPLLVGAGLLVHSFGRLMAVDPGFDARRVLAFQLSPPPDRYPAYADREQLRLRLSEELGALPGVSGVGFNSARIPDFVPEVNNFSLEAFPTPQGEQDAASPWVTATPEFFTALDIPLISGRFMDVREDSPPEMVVDRAWISQHVPDGQDPLGLRLVNGSCTAQVEPVPPCRWWTIVGVVGNVKYMGLDRDDGTAYMAPAWGSDTNLYVYLGTGGDPRQLVAPVRQVMAAVDPEIPLADLSTGDELLTASVARQRYLMTLLGVFASVALALAAVGIYGVMSYFVSQRRRDIGVRIALGGPPGSVVRMVVGQGLRLAAVGAVVGVLASLGLTRFIESLLFGVDAHDPLTFGAITALLGAVTLVACLVPARRAARVDPVVALRED